ncbi:putative ABC transport system substrate-binding protein [Bradyrhizobium sp. LB7.1]
MFSCKVLPSPIVSILRRGDLGACHVMRRREFLGVSAIVALVPLAAHAQKLPARIGLLASGAPTSLYTQNLIKAIKQGLSESSLVEGRDYSLECRYAEGKYEKFPALAHELAQTGATIILAHTIASVRAAQKLNPSVSVIMLSINDPVRAGLVASLSKPAGNTTGLANLEEDLTTKLLEFQRIIVPAATKIAALFNSGNPTHLYFLENLRTQAEAFNMKVLPAELKTPGAIDDVFTELAAQRPDTLQIMSDSGIFDLSDRIAALAEKHRIPSFATLPEFVGIGGLLAYGASRRRLFVRSGYYVARILQGSRPGDLPVEQPTRVELSINLRTAKALGLIVPATLLTQADEVVE